MLEPRVVKAENPGAFTLDGTRTYLVGRDVVAVVDPGPLDPRHIEELLRALKGSREAHVLVTHHHADHAGAAPDLARALGAPFFGPGPDADVRIAPGDRWRTDRGHIVAIPTPGHSQDHLVFHWPEARAVFVGDLILGEGETTWVAEYPGCVGDYLASLDRVADLDADVLYSAHGPPIRDPVRRIALFRSHRQARIRRVAELLHERPGARAQELLEDVYGDRVPPGLESAAVQSLDALLHHVRAGGGEGGR